MTTFSCVLVLMLILVNIINLVSGNEERELIASEIKTEGINLTEISRVVLKLLEDNEKLANKVTRLENKLIEAERKIGDLYSDIQFFNPTLEEGEVFMNIVDWTDGVDLDLLEDVTSYPFEAGMTIGTVSTWTFYLSHFNRSISAHLQLQNEGNNKKALFVRFSAVILNVNGSSFRNQATATTNVLELDKKTLSIKDLINLQEIEEPGNKILMNDSLRIRFKFELLGKGHKLYRPVYNKEVSRDKKTVEFDVKNMLEKIEKVAEKKVDVNVTLLESNIAYSRFQLTHPWGIGTEWTAEIFWNHLEKSVGLTLSLEDYGESDGWDQLFASFKLNIDIEDETFAQNIAPVNDYMKNKFILDGIISAEEILNLKKQNFTNETFVFKIYLSVYGKNARYYVDL